MCHNYRVRALEPTSCNYTEACTHRACAPKQEGSQHNEKCMHHACCNQKMPTYSYEDSPQPYIFKILKKNKIKRLHGFILWAERHFTSTPDVSKIKYHATVYQGHQRRRYWLMFTKEDREPYPQRDSVPVNFINSKWNLSKSLAPNETWKRAPNSAPTKHSQLWRQGWAQTGSRGPQLATSHLGIMQLFYSWWMGEPRETFCTLLALLSSYVQWEVWINDF